MKPRKGCRHKKRHAKNSWSCALSQKNSQTTFHDCLKYSLPVGPHAPMYLIIVGINSSANSNASILRCGWSKGGFWTFYKLDLVLMSTKARWSAIGSTQSTNHRSWIRISSSMKWRFWCLFAARVSRPHSSWTNSVVWCNRPLSARLNARLTPLFRRRLYESIHELKHNGESEASEPARVFTVPTNRDTLNFTRAI